MLLIGTDMPTVSLVLYLFNYGMESYQFRSIVCSADLHIIPLFIYLFINYLFINLLFIHLRLKCFDSNPYHDIGDQTALICHIPLHEGTAFFPLIFMSLLLLFHSRL